MRDLDWIAADNAAGRSTGKAMVARGEATASPPLSRSNASAPPAEEMEMCLELQAFLNRWFH